MTSPGKLQTILAGLPEDAHVYFAAALEGAGHAVACCSDLEATLKAIQLEAPDLLLVGGLLAAEGDHLLLRELRQEVSTARSYVLALALLTPFTEQDALLEAGADDVLGGAWCEDRARVRFEIAIRQAQNMSRLRHVEAALGSSELRYSLAAAGTNEGLWDWDLPSGRIYYSPRWKDMIGYADDEIGDSPREWLSRIHPDDLGRFRAAMQAHVEGRTPYCQIEYRLREKEGRYRWMLCRGLAARDEGGQARRLAGSQADITKRRAYDAHHDTLTRLPNRRWLIERLRRSLNALGSAGAEGDSFALLLLDLDRFRIVVDSLGHRAGDRLLLAFARRVEACLTAKDAMVRLGGDEFVIVTALGTGAAAATQLAQQIQDRLHAPFEIDGKEIFTTASVGIALGTAACEEPEDILRDADTAMHRAKALGKARYQLFDRGMHSRAMEQLQLESELRQALEQNQLRLYYQPIVSLRTGRITGFEALIRWEHPLRGLLTPADFIYAAEETGLIVPIGRWVLREACRQAQLWQVQRTAGPPPTVSVNISGKQLDHPGFLEEIVEILEETGLDHRSLKLEITESAILENAALASQVCARLKALDVQLHLDDFGTGFSSLSHLHQLPVDTLKIDRSFVNEVGEAEPGAKIASTIVTLADKLGIGVIAEGVETAAQLRALQALQCGHAQGFLFSEPVTAEATASLSGVTLLPPKHPSPLTGSE